MIFSLGRKVQRHLEKICPMQKYIYLKQMLRKDSQRNKQATQLTFPRSIKG